MLKMRSRVPAEDVVDEPEVDDAPPLRTPDTGNDFAWAWSQMSAGKVVRIANDPDVTFCIAEVKAARIRMLIATYPNSRYGDEDPDWDQPLNDVQTHHLRAIETDRLFSRDWELVEGEAAR